jgi:DNA modification methylase
VITGQAVQTTHQLHVADARDLSCLNDGTVQLVVTSPPYPMIAMWDDAFTAMNSAIGKALDSQDGLCAFELMHQELDRVWAGCFRVLSEGGFACINIGDATRSIGGQFRLFHNHARIVSSMVQLGFTVLPDILWRKPTNAPNKFMGSGMLPAGAYVTYEHEYILVFRKGDKRVFRTEAQRAERRRSAFFWEERNTWFSDIWSDLGGAKQGLKHPSTRTRSGAFPFELPYRIINMYSLYGDTVLDPFVGTGTTMAAALTTARSSVGFELVDGLASMVDDSLNTAALHAKDLVARRLEAHRRFVAKRLEAGKTIQHTNTVHQVPVITRQEREMELMNTTGLTLSAAGNYTADHVRLG